MKNKTHIKFKTKDSGVFKMVSAAMFAAMIFVLTRFVSVPVASGYVHFGDALIYIVASVMGGPWAFIAAACGAVFADIAAGYLVYAPATLIIKALIAVPFVLCCKKSEKILTPTTALLTIPSGIITVLGYFLSDLIIDKAYAVINITGNVIQAAGSAILFVIVASAFDAGNIKKKLFLSKV